MSWPTTPAYVFGRYLDVLAANALATALAPWFTVGENLVKGAFLDPRRRELRPDWERSLGGTVAALRANVGPDIDDPRLTELVGELSLRSHEFRQLWARHDVRPKGSGTSVMHHPQVGRLELFYTKLPIPDTDRQTLSIYHAAPGRLRVQRRRTDRPLASRGCQRGPRRRRSATRGVPDVLSRHGSSRASRRVARTAPTPVVSPHCAVDVPALGLSRPTLFVSYFVKASTSRACCMSITCERRQSRATAARSQTTCT